MVVLAFVAMRVPLNAQPAPIAHWSFDASTLTLDNGNVTAAADSSPAGRHATLVVHATTPGSLTMGSGQFGDALQFDPAGGAGLEFANFSELVGAGGAEAYTIAVWVNPTEVQDNSAILADWANDHTFWFTVRAGGNLRAQTRHTGGADMFARQPGAPAQIPLNEWSHVAWTFQKGAQVGPAQYENGTLITYVNGVVVDTFTVTAANQDLREANANNSIPANIGLKRDNLTSGLPTGWFRGALDEIWVFTGALTAEEIEQLHTTNGVAEEERPPQITGITPPDRTLFHPVAGGIQFTVTTHESNVIQSSGVQLFLNGEDVSSALTVTGTSPSLNASFDGLEPNRIYTAQAVASDTENRTTTRTWTFDTFVESEVRVIEAEDYNYAAAATCDDATGVPSSLEAPGGSYLNDPVPSAFTDGTYYNQGNGYVDRVGTPGIDYFDSMVREGAANPVQNHAYRFCDPVGTTVTADVRRQKYIDASEAASPGNPALIPDYHVHLVQASEWLNYTREFQEGNYLVFLRGSVSGANQQVELSKVTSDRSQPNQTTLALGTFTTTAGGFGYAQLLNDSGDPVVLQLSGVNTLRLTALEANNNLNLNYLLVVPTTEAPTILGPLVESVTPAPEATDTRRDIIAATIVNRETSLDTGSVKLFVNNVEVTPVTVTSADNQAEVTYTPSPELDAGAELNLRLTYQDTLANPFSFEWSFTTSSDVTPPELMFARGEIDLGTQGLRVRVRFSESVDMSIATDPDNYSISGGVAITGVEPGFRPDEVIITGTGATAGTSYTLTVNDVEDVIGNVISAASTIGFAPVQVIPVPNGDFEDWQVIGDGGISNTGWASVPGGFTPATNIGRNDEMWSNPSSYGSGWQSNGDAGTTGAYGLQHPSAGQHQRAIVPGPLTGPEFSGNFIGSVNTGNAGNQQSIQSGVIGSLAEGTYTLRIAVGARPAAWNDIQYTISLVADPVLGAPDNGGPALGSRDGTVLGAPASVTLIPSTATLGNNQQDLVYTLPVPAGDANIGKDFAIRIETLNLGTRNGTGEFATGFSQGNFDNVRLEYDERVIVPGPMLLNPSLAGNTFSVSLESAVGTNYRLEYKNALDDAEWTPLPVVEGTGGVLVLTDTTATGAMRYYQVVAVPAE